MPVGWEPQNTAVREDCLFRMWKFLRMVFDIVFIVLREQVADWTKKCRNSQQTFVSTSRSKLRVTNPIKGSKGTTSNIPYMPKEEPHEIPVKGTVYLIRNGLKGQTDSRALFHHWAVGVRYTSKYWAILEGHRSPEGELISCYQRLKQRPSKECKIISFDSPCAGFSDLKWWQKLLSIITLCTLLKTFITSHKLRSIKISPKQLHAIAAGIPDAPYVLGINDCQTWVSKALQEIEIMEEERKTLIAMNNYSPDTVIIRKGMKPKRDFFIKFFGIFFWPLFKLLYGACCCLFEVYKIPEQIYFRTFGIGTVPECLLSLFCQVLISVLEAATALIDNACDVVALIIGYLLRNNFSQSNICIDNRSYRGWRRWVELWTNNQLRLMSLLCSLLWGFRDSARAVSARVAKLLICLPFVLDFICKNHVRRRLSLEHRLMTKFFITVSAWVCSMLTAMVLIATSTLLCLCDIVFLCSLGPLCFALHRKWRGEIQQNMYQMIKWALTIIYICDSSQGCCTIFYALPFFRWHIFFPIIIAGYVEFIKYSCSI